MDDLELRALVPRVLSVLVRRGADFATAEDAVQEALIRALSAWRDEMPADPTGWLVTVAWRAFLDMTRSHAARRDREVRFDSEPSVGEASNVDDTLRLYFLCAHPDLTSSSAVALTLRAVGGLTTRQIAQAYLVPEPTMAQRISRAKRTVSRAGVDRAGDLGTVMRAVYLVFNEGYSGDVDLAAEAIRLTRQLAALVDHPEVHGLLALMLLHHARRPSRTRPDGSIVALADQDRSQWDVELIAEGIDITQAALGRDQLGEYQVQAAIAALHADAPGVEDTDWVQIVEWYDELLRFVDSPIVRLNRAVAAGEADGAPAGLAALAEVDEGVPRRDAVAAYLHEKNGELELAARLYAVAARNAPNLAERDHQTLQAARLNQQLPRAAPTRGELAAPGASARRGATDWDHRRRWLVLEEVEHRAVEAVRLLDHHGVRGVRDDRTVGVGDGQVERDRVLEPDHVVVAADPVQEGDRVGGHVRVVDGAGDVGGVSVPASPGRGQAGCEASAMARSTLRTSTTASSMGCSAPARRASSNAAGPSRVAASSSSSSESWRSLGSNE